MLLAAAAGLQITIAQHQSNVLGLKRFVDRVRIADVATAAGCTGIDCVNRSIARDAANARSLDDVSDDEANDHEDGDDEEDETGVEEGNFSC